MAAAAILEKFRMAISPQRLTIYLYSAHRAVIFAIAQLSCLLLFLLVFILYLYFFQNQNFCSDVKRGQILEAEAEAEAEVEAEDK